MREPGRVRRAAARGPAALLVALLATGCSGVRTYPNELAPNFRVHTQVESMSAMKSTVAEFDIHRVDARCETEYLGRVYLDRPRIDVGIPVGGPVYLDFIFASKAFLSTQVQATRYTTVLTPRPGHEYDVQVRYLKGLYSVAIRESARGGGAGRLLERRDLADCRPRAAR
jgi:hypothetical protein